MKVIVLGDGLLGSEVIKQTNWEYISRKKDNLDISNLEESLTTILTNDLSSVDVIVNCIANTNTYSNDRESHWKTNYVFVNDLINLCNSYNIKLVHISTDYVYAGSNNDASEQDVPVHSNNWYSYTKLLSDGLVQLLSNNFLLCRCSQKPTPFPYEGAWIDQIGNFDYVNVIASLIIQLINKNINGLYNVGTETKSIYELAIQTKVVNKTFSPSHVPKNLSMNLNKFLDILNNKE